MKDKDPNKIAAIEQAIEKKYGEETIQNPLAAWNEDKEKEYLRQMKELYSKSLKIEVHQEKIDINGIKVTKKLLNREQLHLCPVCGSFPKKSLDDVCLLKFDCCNNCYIQHIEGREKRWQEGWRPNLKEENK
jgi:formate dehydrogenase maturation protein FdhE